MNANPVIDARHLTKIYQMGEVEVRIVEHSNWVIEPEAVIDAVDERSRLVFASHVSYRTGFRLDIEAIGDQL